jgi:hypothetical protein
MAAATVSYKGYTIHGLAFPVIESGEWLAEALVTLPRPAGARVQRVRDLDDRSFDNREDAEAYALNLGMRWVGRQA